MNDAVRTAYQQRAAEYIALFGSPDLAAEQDRELIADWARGLRGVVVDVGCGPGHWTDFLTRLGVQAEGVDLVPAFVAHAKDRFPETPFRRGTIEELEAADGQLGGILSWYSVIHCVPDRLPLVLREFARCVAPGGSLLLGFFEGPAAEAFPHAVITAYYWSIDAMSDQLESAGFEVVSVHARTDPGVRPQAAIIARRFAVSS